jgi:hypothetical protein
MVITSIFNWVEAQIWQISTLQGRKDCFGGGGGGGGGGSSDIGIMFHPIYPSDLGGCLLLLKLLFSRSLDKIWTLSRGKEDTNRPFSLPVFVVVAAGNKKLGCSFSADDGFLSSSHTRSLACGNVSGNRSCDGHAPLPPPQ